MKKFFFLFIIFFLLFSCAKMEENNVNQWELNNKIVQSKKNEEQKNTQSDVRVIEIVAKNWEYSNKEISVKKWEKVIIKIVNSDVVHGISVPEMQIVDDNEITLDTSKEWVYEFRCANYCWDLHEDMTWKIIIE